MTDEEKNSELAIIEERIKDLSAHRSMWARAGGMGGAMAMQAVGELEELNARKSDILYGTHKKEIMDLESKINSLENANIVQKIRYGKLLKELRARKEELENFDRNIVIERDKTMTL